jgi:hypothetical protein
LFGIFDEVLHLYDGGKNRWRFVLYGRVACLLLVLYLLT